MAYTYVAGQVHNDWVAGEPFPWAINRGPHTPSQAQPKLIIHDGRVTGAAHPFIDHVIAVANPHHVGRRDGAKLEIGVGLNAQLLHRAITHLGPKKRVGSAFSQTPRPIVSISQITAHVPWRFPQTHKEIEHVALDIDAWWRPHQAIVLELSIYVRVFTDSFNVTARAIIKMPNPCPGNMRGR